MLKKRYSTVLSLAVLIACSPTVRFNYDPTVNFKTLRTWAWVDQNDLPENRRIARRNQRVQTDRPLMDKRIEAILERELVSLGYQKVNVLEAQFVVRQYTRYKQVPIETRTRISSNGWGWGWGWGWPGPGLGASISTSRRETYEEGSITIEMMDGKTSQPLWEAVVANALSNIQNPDEADEQITRAIKAALTKLPR